jgi:tetratricopeptide (TPR) repeat protein
VSTPPSDPPARAAAAWPAVRALFEALAELPPAERAARLADPSLDAAVAAEVRSLLAHHDADTGGALSDGAASDAAGLAGAAGREPRGELRGERLGPWVLVEPLGSGGMGEVWLAERADGAFRGRAAIKLLKPGMDSSAVLARFALEQQALARLVHPHIARLLDAGRAPDGRPFFVMEHVEGLPIDQACAGRPLVARLGLFLQLADAVAHAHRNLLVHRDLKPSNVLVDREGRVKLLDFGIAKALDPLEGGADPSATQAGERPFTPHYASPEQVRGEPVSTATDIYSLGVLLYVLLTGERPYGRDASTPAAAARSVLEEEPTRPSSLRRPEPGWERTRRALQGDLDNILLKALEKSAAARYPSVEALAADVRAYLEGRPVSARAATPWYVTLKFLRRHRAAALAAVLGVIGLATGLAAALLQGRVVLALGATGLAGGLVLALVQARRAALARDDAARSRDEARRQLEEIKRITGELVFRYGDTVTLLPGGAAAQGPLLRSAAATLETALAATPDDPELASLVMQTLGRLAELEGNTQIADPGRVESARATVERALALAERMWPRSEAQWRERGRRLGWRFANFVMRTLVVRAQLLRAQGRLEEAAAALRLSAERGEQALPHVPGDASGASREEGRAYLLAGIANAHLSLAQIADHGNLPSLNRPDEALAEYALAERGLRALLAERALLETLDRQAAPGDPATEVYLRHQIATLQGGRALVLLRQGRVEEALVEATQAVELHRGNVEREPRNLAWRDGWMVESNTQAIALLRLGRNAEALEATQRAWDLAEALAAEAGPQSKWAGVKPLLAPQRGRALLRAGRGDEAQAVIELGRTHWRRQTEALRGQPGEAHAARRLANHAVLAALVHEAAGRPEGARAEALTACETLRSLAAAAPLARDAQLDLTEAEGLLARLGPA